MTDSSTLQATIGVVSRLREENAEFRANFASLQAAHEEALSTNAALAASLAQAKADSLSAELATQSAFSTLRAELETKGMEFEAVASQLLSPSELDTLRLSMADAVEGPYKAQISHLNGQLDAAHDAYSALRRDYDLLVTRSQLDAAAAAADAQRIRTAADARVAKEKARSAASAKSASAASASLPILSGELGQARRRIASLEAQNSALKSELASVEERSGAALGAARAETARVAGELDALRQARGMGNLGSELEIARRRSRDLQADLSAALAANAGLEARLEKAEAEGARARAMAGGEAHAAAREAKGLQAALAEAQAEWGQVRAELESEIRALREHNDHVAGSARAAMERASAREASVVREIAAAKAAAGEKEAFLEQTRVMLEARLEEVEALRAAEARGRGEREESLVARARNAEAEAAHLGSDLALARERVNRLAGEVADVRAVAAGAEKAKAALEVELHGLRAQIGESQRRMGEMDRALTEARLRNDAWEGEKRSLLTTVIKLKSKYAGIKKQSGKEKAEARAALKKAKASVAKYKRGYALLQSQANTASLNAQSISYSLALASENVPPPPPVEHREAGDSRVGVEAALDLEDRLDSYVDFQSAVIGKDVSSCKREEGSFYSDDASSVPSEVDDDDDEL